MDERTKKYLAELVERDVAELTDDNKAFLRARKSYLTDAQKAKFAKILEVKKEAKKKK